MPDVVHQLQRLHEIVTRATEATTVDGVAHVLVEEGVAVLGATMGGFWIVRGEELELVHSAGSPLGARFRHLPVAGDAPISQCVRERQPIWLQDAADYEAKFPTSYSRITSKTGCACLPLVVDGRAIGAAVFAFESARAFSDPERAALTLIARQCAHALERLLLVDAERAARRNAEVLARRMTALQALASRLAAARGQEEIVGIIIDEGVGALGAFSAGIWVIEGDDAVLAAQIGSGLAVVEAIKRIPLTSSGSLCDAIRTRMSVFVGSREAAKDRGVYHADRWAEINALAFVPLVVNEVVLGVIGLGFEQPREFDTSEREFVDLFAGHAARAIARDREDRLERLRAETSAALAASLDADVIMKRIGELSVGMFADWCFVDLARGGEFERIVEAQEDPADAPVAEKILACGPAKDHIPAAISSQRPVFLRVVDDAVLQRIAHSPEHLDALRGTRARSFISVPMVVGGRAIGAASWISQSRTFDDRDVRLAIQIGHAAAAAVENARLYSAEADAARRVHKLYELSVALSSARTPQEVAEATARLGREAIGASSIMIWMRDVEGTLRLVGAASPPEWRQQWLVLSNDPQLPANRVIATGEPIFVETPREYASKASVVFQRVQEAGRVNPFAALPLSIAGERTGVIAIAFTGEHRFVPDERTFLFAIARGCEQALERASLYQAEAQARANAESASRAKDEFLAMLGHELRNPLAPIVSALELMRRRNIADGARERSVIERQVSHLMRLVDDLLDISRITRGKIELRRTVEELTRAVEPAVDSVGTLLVQQRHQITVVIPQGLLVDADMSRLSQVVRNLLTNAAKFTPPGGRITLSAHLDGDWIEMIVQDNGRGIAPDLMPRVFEPFVQGAQAVDRAGGGLGLGLSIARNLVELHGGTLRLESHSGGTTAIVRLPRAQRSAEPVSAPEEPKATRSLRVLIVDDNVDAALLLADLLRALGHEPIIAHDGPGALGTIAKSQPQLAILDIGLPGMDGYELAKHLRSVPGLEHVPVVALTGYGQPSDRDRSRAAGFEEHLVKPIDIGRLQSLFARLTS